jgi:hypothetical protein
VGLGALAAAVLGCARRTAEPGLAPGELVMDRCPPAMVLVVTNGTSYPVRVRGSQGTPTASPAGGGTLLRTIQAGAVDTIGVEMRAYQRLGFESAQPAYPQGRQPPATGLTARCVRADG